MKDYGLKRKKLQEELKYYITKIRCFWAPYLTPNKKKRDHKKGYYALIFSKPLKLHHRNSAIPKDKYCIPICFITSDLVLREDIPQLKAGLHKLMKKRLSSKFVSGLTSPSETLAHIDQMDDTLTSWYTFVKIGPFDFDGTGVLQEMISHFDLQIRNVNPSYVAIEACIYLTDKYQQELSDIVHKDYNPPHGYIRSGFMQKKNSSGGKLISTVCHYTEAHLKSDIIYENIVSLKWKFYQQMCPYFKTLLHQKGICPPSINIYKTNISYTDKDATDFWESIGIYSRNGQFIDQSRKLFFTTTLSGRYEHWTHPDLTYIVNADTIVQKEYYYSLDFQIVVEAREAMASDVFRFALLASINEFASKEVVSYKLQLNKIKLKRNCLNKLLKLRYMYEKSIDFYVRYVQDNAWEQSRQKIAQVFDNKELKRAYDYRALTEGPLLAKDRIVQQISDLRADFESKANILEHLAGYKNEKKSRYVNYIMLMIATFTFILVVFPELSSSLAQYILNVWERILALWPK